MNITIIEIIVTAFVPCLAYAVLNKTSNSYYDLIAQTILNTALTSSFALFIYHSTKDQMIGIISALAGGSLGNKFLEGIIKKYINKKFDDIDSSKK